MRALDDLEAPAVEQQLRQFGDERGTVARMRMQGALPVFGTDHVGRIREQQRGRLAFLPGREQAAGMVEVQVRKHDHVDVGVREAGRRERIEQHMVRFDHAIAFAQLRLEEGTDAGLEQHGLAGQALDQQGAAGQRNRVGFIGRNPLLPDRLRRIAEHGAAVEALRIADDRPEFHALTVPCRCSFPRAGRSPREACWSCDPS